MSDACVVVRVTDLSDQCQLHREVESDVSILRVHVMSPVEDGADCLDPVYGEFCEHTFYPFIYK